MSIFVGYPAVYFAISEPQEISPYLFQAALIPPNLLVAMYCLYWRRTSHVVRLQPAQRPNLSPRLSRRAAAVGFGLLAGAVLMRRLDVDLGPLVPAAAFDGAVVVTAALLNRRGRKRPGPGRLALSGVAFATYVLFLFSGGGRLILATLGIAMIVASQRTYTSPVVKYALAGSVVPVLLVFGAIRAPDVNSSSTRLATAAGLGSVVSPLQTFAELLERQDDGSMEPARGTTFAATASTYVPRSLWEDKPIGFGAVLTAELAPELA